MKSEKLTIRSIIMSVVVGIACGSVAWATPPAFHILIDGLSPYYSPYTASVVTGIPVVFNNPTPSPHTVTHDGCRESAPCAFESGVILPGASFQLPTIPPGRYSYHCTLHPIMRGVLEVQEPSQSAAT